MSDTSAFIAGYGGLMHRSFDGGATWEIETLPTEADILDLAVSPGYVYAVGTEGTILRCKRP